MEEIKKDKGFKNINFKNKNDKMIFKIKNNIIKEAEKVKIELSGYTNINNFNKSTTIVYKYNNSKKNINKSNDSKENNNEDLSYIKKLIYL